MNKGKGANPFRLGGVAGLKRKDDAVYAKKAFEEYLLCDFPAATKSKQYGWHGRLQHTQRRIQMNTVGREGAQLELHRGTQGATNFQSF